MNLGTLIEKVQATTSRSSAADDIHVMNAIDSVCRRYYRRKFRFNTRTKQFKLNGEVTQRSLDGSLEDTTDPENPIYYFPIDVLRSIQLRRLDRSYSNQIDEWDLTNLQGSLNPDTDGIPRRFAWEGDYAIHVRPVPEPGYEVELNYLAEIGRPVMKWLDGKWEWVEPITGAKIGKEYENAWFNEGIDLLHWAAVNELCMGVYGDMERASMAGQQEIRALRDLEKFDVMTQQARQAKAHY